MTVTTDNAAASIQCLEIEARTELDLAVATDARNLAERRIGYVRVDAAPLRTVESIEEVRAQLKLDRKSVV